MDDPAREIAQLKDELNSLRRRNARLEAANARRGQLSEALHISEARFRLLVEQSPLSIQILDPDGWTTQVNHAWEKLWGVTLEQMRDYNILHDPQLVAKGIMPYIQRGFAGEAVAIPPVQYDPEETLPDRTRNADPKRWVRAFIYPVVDQAGQLRDVVLIHEDFTERQLAMEALHDSEASYRTLVENFPNGSVFLFDHDLRYTVARGTGLAESGLSADMFEGKTLWEIFPPEVAARDEPALRAALRGESTRVEVPYGPLTYLVHTLPVKDAEGAIVGGMVMTQDITERIELYRQAQDALAARDEFLSIAAHELRTPLATLRGSIELLQRRAARTPTYTLTERDHRTLQVFAEQSQRLQQQIDTLLDLSQIGTNRLSLELKPIDLCRLAERIVDEIQPSLEQHQVSFTCEPASLIVDGDATRLEQVVQNLLQNAVKYSPGGGEIAVEVTRRGSAACIAIADQGIGIPPEAQARLFERFFRAGNAASRGIDGLGIGLAVVSDIVARHGGRVEVESVEGQGSTFRVLLPEQGGRLDPDAGAANI